MSILPSSNDMRTFSIDLKTLNREIFSIEQKILSSMEQHKLSVTVNDTLMTTPNTQIARDYYSAWTGDIDDAVKKEQINQVILYFTKKGYDIVVRQNSSTLNTFVWIINW